MRRLYRSLFVLLTLLLAILLAWLVSRVVQENLILPALQLAWLIRNYFGIIPQTSLWGIVIAIILLVAYRSLLVVMRVSFPTNWARHQVTQTPGRELAFWLGRIRQGPYQRWYVAHHLANLALEILREKGAEIERGGLLAGPDWNPPEDVQKYLQAAVNSSPKTFGPVAKAIGLKSDPQVKTVIEYLETYMEASNEH